MSPALLAVAAAAPPERAFLVERMLEAPSGGELRAEIGSWILRIVPIETLVPENAIAWRPLVGDALRFLFSRISSARLAEKIAAQLDLPLRTPPEKRLLTLIAKMPGLQKIGRCWPAIRESRLRCAKLSPGSKTAFPMLRPLRSEASSTPNCAGP